MDGTNSAGRKVSLLNDHDPPSCLARPLSFAPSLRSRTSSYDSSSPASPPTPPLVRSTSSDSTAMQTPSPITPDFAYDSFFPHQKDLYSPMQPMPAALPYPPSSHAVYYTQPQQPQPQPLDHPATPPAPQTNGRPKKNQYPCPMAKLMGCKDYFTTSGHAARHAKKHTGKKDAICPECNKAFTRKDNMEQHRRTHLTARATSSKASDRDARKAKLRTQQRPKLDHLDSEPSTSTLAQANLLDPALPASPTQHFALPVQPTNSYIDYNARAYPDPNAAYHSLPYGGLNALANAATSHQEQQQSPRFDHDDQEPDRRHY
ncbi:hypothetical protein BDU57DRAFT_523684 [Ampelomyces quisqualis]|uniref:C2H2 type master regulator of conidiophore development brlA n=1 Tax=Ampelomyces quisqualis TaxID=50730 RepID=A0A6A5Q8M6_AMPQU|nr:hypothetical protein BDU57DRAFT_523684 [Ampelomyces quisqualis]